MTASRKECRQALATKLQSEITGQPVPVFYAYQKAKLDGQSPVVVVSSGPAARPGQTFQGDGPVYELEVLTLVLMATAAGAYTEESSENLLDDLEEQIAASVNRRPQATDLWLALEYAGPSEPGVLEDLSGNTYRYETHRIAVYAK